VTAQLITASPAGEMTLIGFYKEIAEKLSADERLVLNHLMRGLSERGWLPSLGDLLTGLEARGESLAATEETIQALVFKRLLTLNESGENITAILGTLSGARTPHRGHLDGGVNVFTFGGFELLSLHTLFVRGVDGSSTCGHCGDPISFKMEDGAIVDIRPNGAAAFQTNWEGTSPLEQICDSSPLFCSNTCLSRWCEAHPELDGLPISSDLLLHVGAMFASESGSARFAMFGMDT
jgi:hypothetical protein